MSKKKIILILIFVCLIILMIFLFSHRKTGKNSNIVNAPEAKEPITAKELITNSIINNKDVIISNIEKILNSAYSDYNFYGRDISEYFSEYSDDYTLDFGSISNVDSYIEDSLDESVDYFDKYGELIKLKEDLPNITYNNRNVEISEDNLELQNGSYYLIRYFDSSSIYTPYFVVSLSNSGFKVGDIWVISSNESYYMIDDGFILEE